ncbi:hypothetical protein Tco_0260606 [Tanacetum coccineum]
MTDKYCPQGVIKKLEIELWNLKVKWNDVPTYIKRFQELTLICTKFVANETEKVDKYISGIPDNIYGNVKSSRPKTLNETIELANDLMDQKLHTYVERQTNNKGSCDASQKHHGMHTETFKRQNVAKVYNMGAGEKKAIRQIPKGMVVLICGAPGPFQERLSKLKLKDGGNGECTRWVYAVWGMQREKGMLEGTGLKFRHGGFS